MNCELTIHSGRNTWLLARTDRDGATEEEVLQSAVAFMHEVIGDPLKPYETIQLPDGRDDVATAIVGNARPMVLSAYRGDKSGIYDGRPLPGGTVRRAQDCAEDYRVRATRPWWVRVAFDWRASDKVIRWPALEVNWWGYRSRGANPEADWILAEARYVGPEMADDRTWGGEMLKGASEAAEQAAVMLAKVGTGVFWAASGLVAVAAGGVLVYLVAKAVDD